VKRRKIGMYLEQEGREKKHFSTDSSEREHMLEIPEKKLF